MWVYSTPQLNENNSSILANFFLSFHHELKTSTIEEIQWVPEAWLLDE